MTKPKVLISDKMDPNAAAIFRERGCEVDEITGLTPDELKEIIGKYDGLAIRSSTKVTKDILDSLTPREAKVLRMRFGIASAKASAMPPAATTMHGGACSPGFCPL